MKITYEYMLIVPHDFTYSGPDPKINENGELDDQLFWDQTRDSLEEIAFESQHWQTHGLASDRFKEITSKIYVKAHLTYESDWEPYTGQDQ